MYVAVDPKSGKPKEYANSAEFFNEVEEATAKPPEKTREVKTYADAARQLNEELGIRDSVAEKEAAIAELIERKVAEGVALFGFGQRVRGARHAFDAAGQVDFAIAEANGAPGQVDCCQA